MKCPVLSKQFEMTAEMEKHVAACPECRRTRADQAALMGLLDEFEAPAVSLDFNRRLWQKLDAAPEPRLLALVRGWLRPAIPLVAAMALVVAGFVYDDRVAPPALTSVSSVDADNVERTLDDIQLLGGFEKTL